MRNVLVRSVLVMSVLAACSVGTGRGEVRGSVSDGACMIVRADYSMEPTFFSADVIEDRGRAAGDQRSFLTIRIQRGSYREGDSDGLMIMIRDANELARSGLGAPIELSRAPGAPIEMVLYLNQTCEAGFPRDFWQIPGVLEASAGTIAFESIYAPDVDPGSAEITARFDGVVFSDPSRDDRIATMSGEFSFQYQRGRPAQYFP